jgi:hypothetical protein
MTEIREDLYSLLMTRDKKDDAKDKTIETKLPTTSLSDSIEGTATTRMPPTTHPDLSELAKQIASLQAQFSEFIAASKSTNTTSTVTEGRKPPIFDASDANTIVEGSSHNKLNVGIVTTAKGMGTDSTGKFDLFLLFFISLYIYIHSHLIFFKKKTSICRWTTCGKDGFS